MMGTILEEHSIGGIPADWLHWVDARSTAGVGHSDRVAQLCEALGRRLPGVRGIADDLWLAAYAHEIGLMSGEGTDPLDLAWRSAELLTDLGCSRAVARIVRHMHERCDGTGGPDRLSAEAIPLGSAILSAADALDHYSAARVQAGAAPALAVDRALGLMLSQQRSVFSPAIVQAALKERTAVRAICGVPREPGLAKEIPRREQRVYPTIATTLLGRLS